MSKNWNDTKSSFASNGNAEYFNLSLKIAIAIVNAKLKQQQKKFFQTDECQKKPKVAAKLAIFLKTFK